MHHGPGNCSADPLRLKHACGSVYDSCNPGCVKLASLTFLLDSRTNKIVLLRQHMALECFLKHSACSTTIPILPMYVDPRPAINRRRTNPKCHNSTGTCLTDTDRALLRRMLLLAR